MHHCDGHTQSTQIQFGIFYSLIRMFINYFFTIDYTMPSLVIMMDVAMKTAIIY